jgi:hypothetical protein
MGVCWGTMHNTLLDYLKLVKKSLQWIPKPLNQDEKKKMKIFKEFVTTCNRRSWAMLEHHDFDKTVWCYHTPWAKGRQNCGSATPSRRSCIMHWYMYTTIIMPKGATQHQLHHGGPGLCASHTSKTPAITKNLLAARAVKVLPYPLTSLTVH